MSTDDISQYGQYVVPFDMGPKGPPRGFVFDGDSGVLDLLLRICARHDWDYLLGRSRFLADLRYALGYAKKLSIVFIWRYPGLALGGGAAWRKHKRARKATPLNVLISRRMIPHASGDTWDWSTVQNTWLHKDLKRKAI